MTWVKIEDTLPGNAKVREVSVGARWAYVASICYASVNRTDGVIPRGALAMVDGTAKIAEELVAAGLWEASASGWVVHDYLRYNRSRVEIMGRSETYSRNGKLRSKTSANSSANGHANSSANGKLIALSGSLSGSDPSDLLEDPGDPGEEREKQFAEQLAAVDAWMLGLPAKDRGDAGLRRDFELLEGDYTAEQIGEALTAIKREGLLPYPSTVTTWLLGDRGDHAAKRRLQRLAGGRG